MTVCLTVTLNGAVLARQERSCLYGAGIVASLFVKLRSRSIPGPFPVHSNSFYSVLFKYKRPGPTKPTNSTSVNCHFNSSELDTARLVGLVRAIFRHNFIIIHYNSIQFKRPKHSNTIQSKILKGRHQKVLFAVLPGFYFERPKAILYLHV